MYVFIIFVMIALAFMFWLPINAGIKAKQEANKQKMQNEAISIAENSKYYREFVTLNHEFAKNIIKLDYCQETIECHSLREYQNIDLQKEFISLCNELDFDVLLKSEEKNNSIRRQYDDSIRTLISNALYFVDNSTKNEMCKQALQYVIMQRKIPTSETKISVTKTYISPAGRNEYHDKYEHSIREARELMLKANCTMNSINRK